MTRTDGQKNAWRTLTPKKRRLLTSHFRDDLEQEMALRHSILTALENVYGPRQWDACVAVLAEGEAEVQTPTEGEDGASLSEIAETFGVTKPRINQIIAKALQKLRANLHVRQLLDRDRYE